MSSDAPTLSIVVPSIEPPEVLGPHLVALLERTGGDCELILVGRAHGMTSQGLLDMGFRRGQIIEGKDRSHAHAINLGLAAATGQALVWMNADDLPTPPLLEAARLAAHARPPRAAPAVRLHSDGTTSLYGVPSALDLTSLATWCPIAQPACLIPSSAIAKVGLLDPGLRLGFDYEYWIRALKAGARFQRGTEVLAEVAIRPEAKSFRFRPEVFMDEAEIHRRHFGCERPAVYEAYWSECDRPAFGYDVVRSALLDAARTAFRSQIERAPSAARIIRGDARLNLLAQGLWIDVRPNGSLSSSNRLWVSALATSVTLWIQAAAENVALLTDGGLVEATPAGPRTARLTWPLEQRSLPSSAQILLGNGAAELSAIAIRWSQAATHDRREG